MEMLVNIVYYTKERGISDVTNMVAKVKFQYFLDFGKTNIEKHRETLIKCIYVLFVLTFIHVFLTF